MLPTPALNAADRLPCFTRAWVAHARELSGWLRFHLGRQEEADDLLQDVFLKALRQGKAFCAVENPRAWLFQVARHALVDRLRTTRASYPLPDELPMPESDAPAAVDLLTQCLPRVLSELDAADRLAIECCDIEGCPQQALADRLGITLSGAKSRLQRARKRLRARLESACQVRYDADGSVCCFTPRPAVAKSPKP
ncbi:MAG: sigma-70 family RNA polymerase sigma factor [Betaproteobacteria bacterium]